jgi:rare lipoprotein A
MRALFALCVLVALANCAGPVVEHASRPAAPDKTPATLANTAPARDQPTDKPSRADQPDQDRVPIVSTCAGKLVRSAFYWQGKKTASGAPFDPDGMTAAHRTLPFGTRLTVTNPRTGKTVEVVVTDRGPYTPGLHLDLSRGAAKAIGLTGTGSVCIT